MNRFKINKRIIRRILCFAIIVCLIVLGWVIYKIYAPRKYGNTSGNITDSYAGTGRARIAENEEYIFYISSDYKIIKMDKSSEHTEVIYESNDCRLRGLNVVDGAVYFIKIQAEKENSSIIKMTDTGEEVEELFTGDVYYLLVINNRVYFSLNEKYGRSMYVMSNTGKRIRKVNEKILFGSEHLGQQEKWQRLFLRNPSKKIHFPEKGSTGYGIFKDSIQMTNKWFFSLQREENPKGRWEHRLYQWSYDFKTEKEISNRVFAFNISNNVLYYSKRNDDSSIEIWRMDIETAEGERLFEVQDSKDKFVYRIEVAGNKIFYELSSYDESENSDLDDYYYVNMDGTNLNNY